MELVSIDRSQSYIRKTPVSLHTPHPCPLRGNSIPWLEPLYSSDRDRALPKMQFGIKVRAQGLVPDGPGFPSHSAVSW